MEDANKTVIEPPKSSKTVNDPVGIGGVLILVIISLALTSILRISNIKDYLKLITTDQLNILVSQFETNIRSTIKLAFIIDTADYFFLLIIPVILLVVLLQRKKIFQKLMIGYYSLQLVLSIIVFWIFSTESLSPLFGAVSSKVNSALTSSVLGALIWIPYFITSKRVKNTFIR